MHRSWFVAILLRGLLLMALPAAAQAQSDQERMQRLLKLAKSEAASERLDAAKGLSPASLPKEATDALLNLLRDPQWFVRAAAADSLGRRRDVSAVGGLTSSLSSETNDHARERITAALTRLRELPEYLVAMLADPDPTVRQEAARRAARRGDPIVIDALVSLLSDPVATVRATAADSLVERRHPAIVAYQIRALETETDAGLRMRAAEALGQLRAAEAVEPLIRALADRSIQKYAAVALGEIGDPRAAQPIAGAITYLTASSWYDWSLALSRLGDAGLTALVGLLANSDESVRGVAARGLQLFKDPRATAALVQTLNDPSDVVRGEAATSLGRLADPAAVNSLVTALQARTGRSNASIAAALGRLKDRRAIPVLLEHLRKPISIDESTFAIQALGDIGGTESVEALVQILEGRYASKHIFVDFDRQYAAQALSRAGGSRADAVLFDALTRLDLPVIQGAATYFIATGRPGSQTLLGRALDPEHQSLHVLAELYLASGEPTLVAAARAWAAARKVTLTPASYRPVKWGQGEPAK